MRARTAFHPRAAIVAAVAIIGVTVFGGALSAAAAPPAAPTIDTYPPTSMAASEIISGTVTATGGGIDMVVMVYNSQIDPANPVCTDTIPSINLPGGWGCDTPLVDGNNTIWVVSYEDDGVPDEFSPPSNSIVIARGGTQAPVITSPFSGDTTDDSTPTFSGTGPVLGSIVVNGGPFSPACSANVSDVGTWSCEATTAMPPDLYGNFQAAATRQDGSAGGFSEFVALTVAPAKPTVSYGLGYASVSVNAVGQSGSGVSVELYSVTEGGEGEGEGGGYSYDLVDGCPAPLEGSERVYAASPISCSFSGLAPGVWNVYTNQVVEGIYSENRNDYFRVPATPSLGAKVNSDRSVTFSGTGQAGGLVSVQTSSGNPACQAAVVDFGWTCTATPAAGKRAYVAYAQDQGFAAATGEEAVDSSLQGISALSASVTVTVPAAPAPTPTPTPTPAVRPLSINFGDITEFRPGDSLTVDGTDAPANATIDVELHSTPILLGTTTADEFGTFSLTTTIPQDAEAGAHHIVVIATPTDGSAPFELEHAVTVIVDPVAEGEQETESVDGAGATPSNGSSRQQPGAPSALSAGFVSPAEILSNPLAVVTAGSLGLALVLLVLVPAEFFGEALANHYGSMAGFFARRRGLKRVVDGVGEWIETHRFLAGAALVFVTSVVFCFIDPSFGFDLTSLRLLLSCAASILLVNFLSSGITERIAEKAWQVPTRLEVMPWGLAIAIVGVIASRILNFSPGFLIGSIIGVSVIGAVSKKLESRVILLWSGVVWAIAMVAWVLAPLVPALPATDPAAFFTGLLGDSLTATAAAGLTALLVALLPIALFDGGVLFKNSKRRWAIAFGIAVASFSLVVLPSASNWLGLGDGLLTWLLLTLGFIAVAIITYLIAVRKNVLGSSRLLKKTEPTA